MVEILSEKTKRPGDLLVHVESLEYCTKTVIIRNATGATVTITDVVGFPLKAGTNGADYNLAEAGDEANVTALLIDGPLGDVNEELANNTNSTKKYQALVHPPAVINRNKIVDTDFAGAAMNVATIVTALEALKYEVRSEPSNSEQL